MKLRKVALGLLVVLVVAGAAWFSLDKETRGLLATLPTNRDLLFWSEPQRDAAFRALDRIPLLAKWRVIPASANPRPRVSLSRLNQPAAALTARTASTPIASLRIFMARTITPAAACPRRGLPAGPQAAAATVRGAGLASRMGRCTSAAPTASTMSTYQIQS